MATDKSDKQSPDANSGKKSADGMSMKERLLAQRKAEAEGGTKPASAPPVPAARPVARPAATPAPAPAARPAATPAPQAARSAAAPAEPAKKPVKLAGAREDARAERGAKKPVSEDVRREIEMLRKRQDKWITYGWMVALGLLLIAGVTYYITSSKKHNDERIVAERKAEVEKWVSEIKALDPNKQADQEKLEAMLKDPNNDKLWKTNISDSNNITVRAKSNFAKVKEEGEALRDLVKGIDEIEATANTAGSKSSEELEKVRRRLTLYEGQPSLAVEQTQRLAKAAGTIDRAYAAKVHEEAKAAAAKGPAEVKTALAAYTKAEDEVIRLLDDSTKKKRQEDAAYYTGHFREIITESDALTAAAFTPDVLDKTAWTELLSGTQKDSWQHPGFTGWQIKDGVLQGNTDLGSRSTSIMSIGDREKWRDFQLEMEFVVAKGDPVLHARLGASVNNTTINYAIGTSGQNAFKPGATNGLTLTVIGSTAKVTYSDADHTPSEDALGWTIARRGGIGISVPAGAEIKVTKMRIKVLR